ncbi:TPR end-of-group domain-containing protein [Acinetobacter baumannii]
MEQNKEELLKHLAASLQDAKKEGGAILLVGAGISVSAGIPPAQKLMQMAIENFPNYFTEEEQELAQEDLSQLQYNDIMTKLSNVKRKELFKWFIEGNEDKGIEKAKLNFAHIAIAELLKQGYFSRVLTVNFDPLLIHACYMVGMYPFPAIYDLGAMGKVNAELLHDPSIVYLNGQHVGFVQRNTTDQLEAHKETLTQIVRSTGCSKTWVVAGYSGENDPLMDALNELRPYNNWLYWLEYNKQVLQKESHHFLENDEECKVIYGCDADRTFIEIADALNCDLDFIEHPEKELELYLKEINFDLDLKKIKTYKSKIDQYIKLFKEYDKNLKEIDEYQKIVSKASRYLDIEVNKISKDPLHNDLLKINEIIALYEKALKMQPNNYNISNDLAISYMFLYHTDKEASNLEKAKQHLDNFMKSESFKKNKENEKGFLYYNYACLESLKNNPDQAFDYLEKAISLGSTNNIDSPLTQENLSNERDLDNIRNDPRFNDLYERLEK